MIDTVSARVCAGERCGELVLSYVVPKAVTRRRVVTRIFEKKVRVELKVHVTPAPGSRVGRDVRMGVRDRDTDAVDLATRHSRLGTEASVERRYTRAYMRISDPVLPGAGLTMISAYGKVLVR